MLLRVGAQELLAMLRGASEQIIVNERLLTELDCVAGDGDHGTTMCRTARTIAGLAADAAGNVSANAPGNVSAILAETGNLFLRDDGGASAGFLGLFFLAVAEGCESRKELDSTALAAALNAGLSGLKRYSKAGLGDKTMLDALEPAVRAMQAAASRGEPVEVAMEAAARAAAQGASDTKGMKARFGRAQHLGERTLGHQDPGATTIAFLFQGFVNGLKRFEGALSSG